MDWPAQLYEVLHDARRITADSRAWIARCREMIDATVRAVEESEQLIQEANKLLADLP